MKKFVVLMFVLLLIGCEKEIPFEQKQQYDDGVIIGINQFGYEVLSEIHMKDSTQNIIFSPLSCTAALAMLENGASGESLNEIRNVLHTTVNSQSKETYYSLITHFRELSQNKGRTPMTVNIHNSLWHSKEFELQDNYVTVLNDYFNADIEAVDFKKSKTSHMMNEWVDKKTKGMIKKIVEETKDTDVLYLINTLYFDGRWREEFHKARTTKEIFTLNSGKEIMVDMMTKEAFHPYYENKDFQLIQLDYGQAAMYIILPKKEIGQWLKKYEDFQVLDDLESKNVLFSMPKFEISNQLDLIPILKSLGLSSIFDGDLAELNKMLEVSVPVEVSKMIQNARIIVDEEGTEAAAVTAIEVEATSAMITDEPLVMSCNRPFLFVIRDNETHTNLFIGMIQNPEE